MRGTPLPELPITADEAAALERARKGRQSVDDQRLVDGYLARVLPLMGRGGRHEAVTSYVPQVRTYHTTYRSGRLGIEVEG